MVMHAACVQHACTLDMQLCMCSCTCMYTFFKDLNFECMKTVFHL